MKKEELQKLKLENQARRDFLNKCSEILFKEIIKLQKDKDFSFRLAYEKKKINQYFHFNKYLQKAHFLLYMNGNIVFKEDVEYLQNELVLFEYSESTEQEREDFLKKFKKFIKQYFVIYVDGIGGAYHRTKGVYIWEDLK
jgi:hypothetical protein